ncbi:hypothetical protein Tco_1552662, partial [Tanacetum coccineum]
SKTNNGEGTSKSPQTTTKSPQTIGKSGEGCSQSPKWTKSMVASDRGKTICGFRLYAFGMSTENSFQIKSLKPEHKCSRNYNLVPLVTYKWIAHHYVKHIIAYTFIPYLKMKSDIREKYLINVSIGQCKRAKQRALYNFEGVLKEHYGRLWEYRQAIFDSNPGSTCRIDDEVTSSGNNYFRRIYVCFKGVKDGWLAGCRKVIELDGNFLKHTCRGELLVV